MATYISTRFVYTHKLWKFPLISSLFLSCSTVRRKIPFFQHSCILMYPSKSSVMHHDGFSCAIFFFYQAHALQAQTNICTFFKQTIDLSSLFWKKKNKNKWLYMFNLKNHDFIRTLFVLYYLGTETFDTLLRDTVHNFSFDRYPIVGVYPSGTTYT